jgi:hypothetical protein
MRSMTARFTNANNWFLCSDELFGAVRQATVKNGRRA